jgi:NAD(P)H-hydrate epimerase
MKVTEAMTIPLPETAERSLSMEALPVVREYMPRMDALVLGPGLGQHLSTGKFVESVLREATCPVVLDADGLNLVAKTGSLEGRVAESSCPLVITPHPGEMARLLGSSVLDVQQDRVAAARAAAQRFSCTVVLKGAGTIVAASDGRFWVNTTGNAGMATGGTGDVLAGIIGGCLAGGIAPIDGAKLGVYAHGLAGDLVSEEIGATSLIAGDLVEALPKALQIIQQEEVKERWIYLE